MKCQHGHFAFALAIAYLAIAVVYLLALATHVTTVPIVHFAHFAIVPT